MTAGGTVEMALSARIDVVAGAPQVHRQGTPRSRHAASSSAPARRGLGAASPSAPARRRLGAACPSAPTRRRLGAACPSAPAGRRLGAASRRPLPPVEDLAPPAPPLPPVDDFAPPAPPLPPVDDLASLGPPSPVVWELEDPQPVAHASSNITAAVLDRLRFAVSSSGWFCILLVPSIARAQCQRCPGPPTPAVVFLPSLLMREEGCSSKRE